MSESVAAAAEATNAKLDSLAEQLAGLASWMKSVDASVADLSAVTTTLKLHAEDAAARLGVIKSRPHHNLHRPGSYLRHRCRARRQRDGPMGTATTILHGGTITRPPGLADFPRAMKTEQENVRQQQQRSSSSSRTNYRAFHNTNKTKHSGRGDEQKKPEAPRWDDKLEALRAFRKSKGQCFTCGEKWSRTHKCPTQVPLHILEELLDVLPPDPDSASDDDVSSGDELMCVDAAAIAGSTPARRRTIRLHGHVGEHEVLILVDSGSGASFIDTRLVDKLHASPQPCEPSQFVIANGDTMISDTMLPNLAWRTQGHTFEQDMRYCRWAAMILFWARIGWRNSVRCGYTGAIAACVSSIADSALPCRASKTRTRQAGKLLLASSKVFYVEAQ
ncbi:hypothetical protein QYE76_032571 [Lolium multiflorum]|uniref:Uncharacterized protein n=1 Tax=Lolium multiflorum TaxID=4521 RepID=A0AAD8VLH9_LOLMU|nr:hypothetical protein QYE76_032571 [Lolium multiflorum]